MCNRYCEENHPCCTCKYNMPPYKCNLVRCGETKDYCAQEEAENALLMVEEASHEIPDPPYDYVEVIEN